MYKNHIALRITKMLLLLQLVLTLLLGVVSWAIGDIQAGYSALLGGMVCIIPSQIFAYRLFRYSGAQAAKQIVHSFYSGEFIKLSVSALLFAAVFIIFKVTALAFFVTFIIVQMSHWLAPLMFASNNQIGTRN